MHRSDEEEVRHYARILRQAIRAAGVSVTEVERRLGVGPKSLRRVFSGQIDLKFRHLVAVLRVIDMPHEEFFSIAARRRHRASASGDLLAAFQRPAPRPKRSLLDDPIHSADPLAPPSHDEDFDRLVEDALTRVLRRRATEGRPPGAPPAPRLDETDPA
jgi:transcriptional regulator with XRE-family HTH domain